MWTRIVRSTIPVGCGRSPLSLAVIMNTAKSRRSIVLGVLGVLVIAYAFWVVVPNLRHRSEILRLSKALQSLSRDRIASAMQAFMRDRRTTNGVVSPSISLEELVSGNYLRADEAEPFGGAHVTLFSGADDTHPQMVLAAARFSDDQVVALLSDGSVQQLTRARYRDQIAAQAGDSSQSGRRGDCSPRLPHHRTCGSASGGS
jgi:hypothetical protein